MKRKHHTGFDLLKYDGHEYSPWDVRVAIIHPENDVLYSGTRVIE